MPKYYCSKDPNLLLTQPSLEFGGGPFVQSVWTVCEGCFDLRRNLGVALTSHHQLIPKGAPSEAPSAGSQSDDASPLNEPNQHHDDSHHDQNVDESSHGVTCNQSKYPENDENNGECV